MFREDEIITLYSPSSAGSVALIIILGEVGTIVSIESQKVEASATA